MDVKAILGRVLKDKDRQMIFSNRFQERKKKPVRALHWNAPNLGEDGEYALTIENFEKAVRDFMLESQLEVPPEENFDETWRCSIPDCFLCSRIGEDFGPSWDDLLDLGGPTKKVRFYGGDEPRVRGRSSIRQPRARGRAPSDEDDVDVTIIPKFNSRAPRWFKLLQITPYTEYKNPPKCENARRSFENV